MRGQRCGRERYGWRAAPQSAQAHSGGLRRGATPDWAAFPLLLLLLVPVPATAGPLEGGSSAQPRRLPRVPVTAVAPFISASGIPLQQLFRRVLDYK
jgi:hypothetical protein